SSALARSRSSRASATSSHGARSEVAGNLHLRYLRRMTLRAVRCSCGLPSGPSDPATVIVAVRRSFGATEADVSGCAGLGQFRIRPFGPLHGLTLTAYDIGLRAERNPQMIRRVTA